jgi:hypothetical protein
MIYALCFGSAIKLRTKVQYIRKPQNHYNYFSMVNILIYKRFSKPKDEDHVKNFIFSMSLLYLIVEIVKLFEAHSLFILVSKN